MQIASFLCSGISPSVAYLALSYCTTLYGKRHDFRENIYETLKGALIFSTTLSETFLILRRNQRDTIINIQRFSSKVPVILFKFLWNLNFIYLHLKKSDIKFHVNPLNVSRVVLHKHTNRRRERFNEANSRFSQFLTRLETRYIKLHGKHYLCILYAVYLTTPSIAHFV
jgi:hypothetical protein